MATEGLRLLEASLTVVALHRKVNQFLGCVSINLRLTFLNLFGNGRDRLRFHLKVYIEWSASGGDVSDALCRGAISGCVIVTQNIVLTILREHLAIGGLNEGLWSLLWSASLPWRLVELVQRQVLLIVVFVDEHSLVLICHLQTLIKLNIKLWVQTGNLINLGSKIQLGFFMFLSDIPSVEAELIGEVWWHFSSSFRVMIGLSPEDRLRRWELLGLHDSIVHAIEVLGHFLFSNTIVGELVCIFIKIRIQKLWLLHQAGGGVLFQPQLFLHFFEGCNWINNVWAGLHEQWRWRMLVLLIIEILARKFYLLKLINIWERVHRIFELRSDGVLP